MKISELLIAMASWLESPDNEAVLLAEYNDDCLDIVANSCVIAANELKKAAEQVDKIEPEAQSVLTPEGIEGLADIATAFDSSSDEGLKKQAAIIDELLLTIAAPPNVLAMRKDLLDNRIDELKKLYNEPREDLKKSNGISEIEKKLQKNKMMDKTMIHDQPLLGRNCADHPGAQLGRVGQDLWKCELDGKIYDYENGFTLENGTKVPGGSVSLQTNNSTYENHHALFDSREDRLGTNKP